MSYHGVVTSSTSTSASSCVLKVSPTVGLPWREIEKWGERERERGGGEVGEVGGGGEKVRGYLATLGACNEAL